MRGHVRDRNRDTRAGGPLEALVLEVIEGTSSIDLRVTLSEVIHEVTQGALGSDLSEPRIVLRQRVIEQGDTQSGLQKRRLAFNPTLRGRLRSRRNKVIHRNRADRVQIKLARIERHDRFSNRREATALTNNTLTAGSQVVQTDDHVLRRQRNRAAIRRLQNVVRRQHQDARLSLSLRAQRQVHSHLVTIEVSVERCTRQWVQLQSLTLNELRLKRLNTQAVQGWCTVQQNRVLSDDLFKNIPHRRAETLNHTLSCLDVLSVVQINQALHHERLKQLKRHLLRQTTLVQLQLRTNHDDRTARVVNTLTQQVLTETTLLTLEHVRQRLQRAVTRASLRAATATVVKQRVNRLLQHALLVVHDDLWSAQIHETLQAVVAVDHTTVEVVEVRGSETATIKLNHRAQLRRNHRNSVKDHTLRRIIGRQESVNNLQTLDRASLTLTLTGSDHLTQRLCLFLEVEVLQALLDRLSTHQALKEQAILGAHRAEQRLVTFKVTHLDGLETLPHLGETLNLGVRILTDVRHFLLSGVASLLLLSSLSALTLKASELFLKLLSDLSDISVTRVSDVLDLNIVSSLQVRQLLVTAFLINRGDHVRRKVNNLLEVLRRQIKQVTQTRRNALEVPNMRHRSSQLDVAHTFTANLRTGHLNATTLTNNALETDTLVLTARALPVTRRTENLLTKQAILLRLECAVVNGLRLLNLAVAPFADLFSRSQTNTHQSESRFGGHKSLLSFVKKLKSSSGGSPAQQHNQTGQRSVAGGGHPSPPPHRALLRPHQPSSAQHWTS